MKPNFVAVLWPDEKNYARFREVSDGISQVDLAGYRAAVSPKLDALERSGVKVIRIGFEVDDLIAFARREGVERVISDTRARFAIAEHYRQSGGKRPN